MTKKTADNTAPATPATPAGDAPAPAPAFPLPVDEFHGVGGEYVMENGVRRRVGGPPLPGAEA